MWLLSVHTGLDKLQFGYGSEYQGCFIDDRHSRDMSGQKYFDRSNMTIGFCSNFCLENGKLIYYFIIIYYYYLHVVWLPFAIHQPQILDDLAWRRVPYKVKIVVLPKVLHVSMISSVIVLLLGFIYFGLQYFWECRCDTDYGRYGRAPEVDCYLHCAGDNRQICGGAERNSVWKTVQHWQTILLW